MKKFNFFLPTNLRERMENYIKEKISIPLAQLIIQAIDEFLEKRGY